MTKLDATIERLRALPADEQDHLAREIESLIDETAAPAAPADQGAPFGDDAELQRRIASWRTHRRSVPAADLHAELRRRHGIE